VAYKHKEYPCGTCGSPVTSRSQNAFYIKYDIDDAIHAKIYTFSTSRLTSCGGQAYCSAKCASDELQKAPLKIIEMTEKQMKQRQIEDDERHARLIQRLNLDIKKSIC
jgi:ferredoxin